MCEDLLAVCQWSLINDTLKTWTTTKGLMDAERQERIVHTMEAEEEKNWQHDQNFPERVV